MPATRLNWATAKVEDAKLAVGLEGKVPSRWKKSFETTVRRLGRGDWGDVRLAKRTVTVDGVTPGTEAKLRHYLESVVAQANASEQSDEPKPEADDEDAGAPDNGGPDAQMTERFRSFADADQTSG